MRSGWTAFPTSATRSDRDGMRIVIELKKRRSTPHDRAQLPLQAHLSMQETFGANMLALVDGEPKVLNLQEMIYHYIRPPEGSRHPPHPVRPEQGRRPVPTFWRVC